VSAFCSHGSPPGSSPDNRSAAFQKSSTRLSRSAAITEKRRTAVLRFRDGNGLLHSVTHPPLYARRYTSPQQSRKSRSDELPAPVLCWTGFAFLSEIDRFPVLIWSCDRRKWITNFHLAVILGGGREGARHKSEKADGDRDDNFHKWKLLFAVIKKSKTSRRVDLFLHKLLSTADGVALA